MSPPPPTDISKARRAKARANGHQRPSGHALITALCKALPEAPPGHPPTSEANLLERVTVLVEHVRARQIQDANVERAARELLRVLLNR